jgi:hypothetical protein
MRQQDSVSLEVVQVVTAIGSQLTSEDIDVYDHLRTVEDRSYRERTETHQFAGRSSEERMLRRVVALSLLVITVAQIAVANVFFVLLGTDALIVDEWVAGTFFLSVFVEIVGLFAIVIRYLFPGLTALNSQVPEGPQDAI